MVESWGQNELPIWPREFRLAELCTTMATTIRRVLTCVRVHQHDFEASFFLLDRLWRLNKKCSLGPAS